MRVGKRQSTVANKMRLLKLPDAVRATVLENNLTERHARVLLKIKNENDQLTALNKVIKNQLNVRKTEELIERMLSDAAPSRNTVFVPFIRDIRILTNSIKETLDAVRHSGVSSQFDMTSTPTGYEIHITLDYPAKGAGRERDAVRFGLG